MSTYGNVNEIWLVCERGRSTEAVATATFTSEKAARDFAAQQCTRHSDYCIYRATLAGTMVLDSPRWVGETS